MLRAEELSAQYGYVVVPPFNDEFIIAGQGTMGLEILEDLPDVETVLVPVGGGGMLSGISAAIKLGAQHPVKVIGVEPEFAADAQASFRAGHIVNWSPEQVTRTLADGLRTQSLGDIRSRTSSALSMTLSPSGEEEIREAVRRLSVNPSSLPSPAELSRWPRFSSIATNCRRPRATSPSLVAATSTLRCCWKFRTDSP